MKLILELEQSCDCKIGKSDVAYPVGHGAWLCAKCGRAFKYRNAYCHADEGEPPPQEEEAQERYAETMREIRGPPPT